MTGRRKKSAGGFTLLEVMLAIGLVVSLMGSAIWFVSSLAKSRDRINESTQEIVARRATMRRITKELRCAMNLPKLGLGVTGGKDYIAFITTSLPGRSVWVDRSILDQPLPPETDLKLITYRQAVREDEEGQEYIVGIERTCQKLLDAPEVEEGENLRVTLITEKLKLLRFSYYDGAGWTTDWTEKSGLPLAIRVTLGDEPIYEDEAPEDSEPADMEDVEVGNELPEDYVGRVSRRMIRLPLSVMKTEGTIIRGGPGGGGR